jgi:predicted nuclease of restriction endonuclease-like (RecB) superfamily
VTAPALPSDYTVLLADIKGEVVASRHRARVDVNTELVGLYHRVGTMIRERQAEQGWGAKVVERLAADLRHEFPEMKGWSRTNLGYMRTLAEAWPEVLPQPVGKLPWGHVRALLDRLDTADERGWYAEQALRNGWSRAMLTHHIASRLHDRAGAAPTNFAAVLPDGDSALAQQLTRDPYHLGFLGLSTDAGERELEDSIATRIIEFMLALGDGFAFVGRQVHLDVDGDDFYLDLLFYNYRHHRFVVIELKTGKFRPEHLGQLGFYVAVVDDRYRTGIDQATIGILLCTHRNETVVRYSLAGQASPVAVAGYTHEDLPDGLREELPELKSLDLRPVAFDPRPRGGLA